MNIHVIIVNYKSYIDTINYIHRLQCQKKINIHITVVDNNSQNNSYSFLIREFRESEEVTILQAGENGGYAKGNNFGLRSIKIANNDLVVISNNDLIIDDDHLFYKWAIKHSKLENVAISAPTMHINDTPSIYAAWKIPSYVNSIISSSIIIEKLLGDKKRYTLNTDNSYVAVDCLPGSLFMVRYDVFKELGFFDEGTFLYMEETILGRKVKEIYKNNYLIRDLFYKHETSKTISAEITSYKMRKHLADSICYYHKKYDNKNLFECCVLKFLYYVWCLEYKLLHTLNRKSK